MADPDPRPSRFVGVLRFLVFLITTPIGLGIFTLFALTLTYSSVNFIYILSEYNKLYLLKLHLIVLIFIPWDAFTIFLFYLRHILYRKRRTERHISPVSNP